MDTKNNQNKQKVSFENLKNLSQINNKDLLKMDKEIKSLLGQMESITKIIRENFRNKNQEQQTSVKEKEIEKQEEKPASIVIPNKTETKIVEKSEQKQKTVRQFDKDKRNTSQFQQKSNNFNQKPQFKKDNNVNIDFSVQPNFSAQKRVFDNSKKKDERRDRNGFKEQKSKRSLMRKGIIEENSITERIMGSRKIKTKKNKEQPVVVQEPISHAVITTPVISIKNLSEKTGRSVADILKQLMILGIMSNVNSTIDFTTAELVSSELGVVLEQKLEKSFEEKLAEEFNNADNIDTKSLQKRPPIVTVLGHVDHGKTSLLDYIRNAHIASTEAGGITQHISAYQIEKMGQKITFIDTPGHEAFSAMRARGASITDVAILVVAADDGIKPQTREAIHHIQEAKVPMIVAVNKIDKPEANIERVKQQLTEENIIPEEWGGDAIIVPISALTGEGIDKLLEMVLLVADLQDLKASPNGHAQGIVLEAKLDKGKGPIATVIVLNGTLNVGDTVIAGMSAGKVRALINDKGANVKKALPSTPVAVLGLDGVPNAGDNMYVVDEKMSKQVLAERKRKMQTEKINAKTAFSMEDFLSKSADSEKKIFNIIVKTDVRGTFEALTAILNELQNDEVKVECIHGGVGAINENDVLFAKNSNALIVGFNVKPDSKASAMAEHQNVEIYLSRIIYQVVEKVEQIIKSMRTPVFEEKIIGHAEVIRTFKISRIGTVAGCVVKDGVISKNAHIRLKRGKDILVDTSITTLQKDRQDIKEVSAGMECGIKLEGYNDILLEDILEAYVLEEVIRD